MKKILKISFCIVLVVAMDLISKHYLFLIDYKNLIPNVLSIASNGGNTGAAWGMFSGQTIALIIVSVVMIVALFIFNYFIKNKNTFYCISFGFIIGGALGNLYDRIFLGYVRDFIFLDFFPTFPVFNVADSFLTIGAVMMAIFILFMSGAKNEK